jgi:HK97 family phage major capsid protein
MAETSKLMQLDDVVRSVAEKINPQLLALMATPEGRAAIATAVNERLEEVRTKLAAAETGLAEERALRTEAEKAAAQAIAKVERGMKYQRNAAFHIGADGKSIEPSVSDEAALRLVQIVRSEWKKDRAGTLAFGAMERDVDSSPSSGGVFVPTDVATEILRLIPATGTYPRIAMDFPMGTATVNIGAVIGGMSAYWVSQNTAITPSFPGFDKLVLAAEELGALIPVPRSLIEDAVINFGQLIADLVRQCLALEIDRVGIVGSIAGGDLYNGLVNTPGINVLARTGTGSTTMAGTLDEALAIQNILPDGAKAEGASYLLSPTYFNWLRSQKMSTGEYIYQRPDGDLPGTLWGRPYDLSYRMPAFQRNSDGTPKVVPSTRFLAYGNWKAWAFYGHRNQMEVATSDVAGEAFARVQILTRGIIRVGFASWGPALAVVETAAA